VHRYQNLLSGAEDVESCLLEQLPEYLNCEIVLQTVKDLNMAVAWLKSTFLYTRLRKNPQHYLPSKALPQSEAQLDDFLRTELILKNAQLLTHHGLVRRPGASMPRTGISALSAPAGLGIVLRPIALLYHSCG
jgi:ATP-dependent DNA helicase HFM1/MER3